MRRPALAVALQLLAALVAWALFGCGAPARVCWQPKLDEFGLEVKANRRPYWGPGYLCGVWPAHLRRT